MIPENIKTKIVAAMELQRSKFASDAAQAVALGINAAQLNRIKKGDTQNVLSHGKWINIARKLDVQLNDAPAWVTAKTNVFHFVYTQLETCQNNSLSGILCDMADIGKTYTARQYVKEHQNSVYVDCAQVKSRQKLIRYVAQEFGVNHTSRYTDVYNDLIYYLRSIDKPIIVLDEAGDLDYPAFLELKALWNATERFCAWYMMGAEGLEAKITRNKDLKKVGYTEIFSRFGNKYQQVVPQGKEAREDFIKRQVAMVAKVNGAIDIQKIYARTGGSLRRVFTEVQKLKAV
ncbi:AAA family ATPase [Pedobacter jeongneungensis]|uniref:AAA family ATPase n=1 Tax=Pedobacter jeongneungensis TaxID=947309 RepID=UPI000467F4F2|nr:AAA family ATPase [Pedobacter jeongneungensis]